MAESKGSTGAETGEPRSGAAPKKAAARKATAKAAKPTPESIGIEGVVRVGGHHLDPDEGWVPDTESEPEEGDD